MKNLLSSLKPRSFAIAQDDNSGSLDDNSGSIDNSGSFLIAKRLSIRLRRGLVC
ncbi:MAG: hypothetical protein ACOX6X_04590 [Dethiobacteria bacterium]